MYIITQIIYIYTWFQHSTHSMGTTSQHFLRFHFGFIFGISRLLLPQQKGWHLIGSPGCDTPRLIRLRGSDIRGEILG